MTGKALREALRNGKRVYGTLIVSTSPRWLDIIGQLKLDFVFIDTEHISIDREILSWMCHGYMGKGIAPVVRIPSPNPYQAVMALDGGAKGIVAPYVETVLEVQQLRGAVKTRPLKGRKLNDYLDGRIDLEPGLAEYVEKQNEDHVLIINIESQPAIEQLDNILNIPGIDAVLIGPHDLSCSLGVPEQYDHPKFRSAVQTIITKARTANIGAGIHAFFENGVEKEIEWAKMGANLILHSGDITHFAKTMRNDIISLRQSLNDDFEKPGAVLNI